MIQTYRNSPKEDEPNVEAKGPFVVAKCYWFRASQVERLYVEKINGGERIYVTSSGGENRHVNVPPSKDGGFLIIQASQKLALQRIHPDSPAGCVCIPRSYIGI